ncbi:MAG TPA: 2-amino-3,7-dideoxy-D-threo-hept-6-ulosonate synthase [Clostridia bacterium]
MNHSAGKLIRMKRIFNEKSGNAVLVPLDHGVTMGPIEGLKNIKQTIVNMSSSNIDGVILHKGVVNKTVEYFRKDMNLLVHLNASTEISKDPNLKTLVCTVEEAIQLGADGVSMQINLGSDNEASMLKDFGEVGKKCSDWGMPLLAMMYTRGGNIKNETASYIKLAARVACELGADMVKVNFTGDIESFRNVVEGCSIPVLVAGGKKASSADKILKDISMAMAAGARGVACGRNVFQHENPVEFCRTVSAIVHEKASIDDIAQIKDDSAMWRVG